LRTVTRYSSVAIFVSALLAVLIVPAGAQTVLYADVSGAHAVAIEAITDAGIAAGCAEDRYCPQEPVRRDQMASFVAQALELELSPDPASDPAFSDVGPENPHRDAIVALAEAGITAGCAEGRFCPDASIIREQMATFLADAFDLPEAEVEYFHDVGAMHGPAAQQLGEAGISAGCDPLGLTFCPHDSVSRAQMASFLARATGLMATVSIPVLLEPGDEGSHVEALQRRLAAHDYWVGPIDGVYGTLTEHAVLAVQKVHGLARDGIYGPSTRAVVADPAAAPTRTSSGYVVEFDEDRQIVMLVRDGVAEQIFPASGGNEEYHTYAGTTYWAETPNGDWDIYRQIDGWRTSHLGQLYRPKYFHTDGIAFHGSASVPAQAASHGCVRVSIEAMDWIWANDVMPIGTDVSVYGSPN